MRQWRGGAGWIGRVFPVMVPMLALVLGAASWGCTGTCSNGAKVTFPSSDASPPTLAVLEAHFPSQATLTVTNASGPVTAKISGTPVIRFVAASEDLQGAGPVEIWVEETTWSGNSQTGPGLLGGPAASTATPRPSSTEGCSRNLAVFDYDVAKSVRGATALRVRAWTVAKNTAGASVRSQVMQLDWP
jgi:hypothetical protein